MRTYFALAIAFFLIDPKVTQASDCKTVLSSVSHEEISQRLSGASQTAGANHLVGFKLDQEGALQPIFVKSNSVNSVRAIETDSSFFLFGDGWNSQRTPKLVNLTVTRVASGRIHKTSSWPALPHIVQKVLMGGYAFETLPNFNSPNIESEFSVLMMDASRVGDPFQGRTGILFYHGSPLMVRVNGVEHLVEIKGVGLPSGGYGEATSRLSRGSDVRASIPGGCVAELNAEVCSFNRIVELGPNMRQTQIAGAVEFNGVQPNQQQIFRLSPGSIRLSFETKDGPLSGSRSAEDEEQILTQLGIIWAELLIHGIVPATHPENFVVGREQDELWLTDHSDLIPFEDGSEFPTVSALKSFVVTSFRIITEFNVHSKINSSISFFEGFERSLKRSSRLTPQEINEVLPSSAELKANSPNIKRVVEELFLKILNRIYFERKLNTDFQPKLMWYDATLLDEATVLAQLENKLRDYEHNLLMHRTIMFNRATDEGRPVELEKLENDETRGLQVRANAVRETGLTYEGIRRVLEGAKHSAADEASEKALQELRPNLEYIFRAFHPIDSILAEMIRVLRQERILLNMIRGQVSQQEQVVIDENLEVVREKLYRLNRMTPIDFLELTKQVGFSREDLYALPYWSPPSDDKSRIRQRRP